MSINNQTAAVKNNNNLASLLNNVYIVLFIELVIVKGPYSAVSKLVLKNLDSFQATFYMFGIAVLVFTIIFVRNGKIKELFRISLKDYIFMLIYSVPYFLSVFFGLLAYQRIPASEVIILTYLYPVMITLFAVPINGEKLNLVKVCSVFIGLIGMVIIVTKGNLHEFSITNISGDIFAIGGAIAYAIFSTMGKKNRIDVNISNYVCIFISFVLSAAVMFMFSKFTVPENSALIGILWIGINNGAVSIYLWIRALKLAPASVVANIAFLVPFISLVFIRIFIGEKILLVQLIGFSIVIAAILLQNIYNYSRPKALNT